MSIKLSNENVYAHIMLSEDSYTPVIELESDVDTIASFVVQAATCDNYGIRIVDMLDCHICDISMVDMGIFKELRYYTHSEVVNTYLRLKANELLRELTLNPNYKLPKCDIQNVEYWGNFIDDATDKSIKEDLNKRLYSNFK